MRDKGGAPRQPRRLSLRVRVSKQYRGTRLIMGGAVYNSGIPSARLNSVCRLFPRPLFPLAHIFRVVATFFILLGLAITAAATDWSQPEQQLARKIVAVTGPGAMALSVENRSSLGKREQEIIQNGLRGALETAGLRFVDADQSAATIAISLSENATDYVWVAQIRQGANETAVVMVSMPRPAGSVAVHESVPLSLRKTLLWTQDDAVLDVAVLEDNGTPTHIAVLNAEKVATLSLAGGKMAAGAGAEHRPCTAVAAGFARQAGSRPRSSAGCLFARRDLPQHARGAVVAELPRDG